MNGKFSPGQRARLAALGIDPSLVGRVFNRAAPPVPPKNIPVPKNAAEFEEMLADRERLGAVLANRETFKEFVIEYAKQQQGDGTELARTVRDETQRAMIAWLKDNELDNVRRLNLSPESAPGRNKYAAHYNPDAPGAGIEDKFTSPRDYWRHAAGMAKPELLDADAINKMREIKNAYSSVVPSDGGFLIPESLRAELLRVALESAVVRPRARVIPMETLRVPIPMIDSTTNVGSVFGGMIAYWTEEGAALTASQAKFGRVMLEAKKLTAYGELPNELVADSLISLTALIDQLAPETLAFFEDLAFMKGTGAGEPLGFIGSNNPASLAITKETGQLTATIVWENVIKMYARMFPASLGRAVWLASPDTFPELATMALSVGTGGSAVWLNNGAQGPPMTILGRPVIVTEKLNALGTRGDLAFVDLNYYLIGDRQTMSTATSTDYKFGNDILALRIIERVDGRPWLQSAITPANGGNTLSAFVEIETR